VYNLFYELETQKPLEGVRVMLIPQHQIAEGSNNTWRDQSSKSDPLDYEEI
jgi:hypothetical protein